MFNFGFKLGNFSFGEDKRKFLGIDIGGTVLKITEMESKEGKLYLSNYAWVEIPKIYSRSEKETETLFEIVYPEYIKKALEESGIKSRNAYVGIATSGSLIMVIDFPQMEKEELNQAIKFEAQKYIPMPMEEISMSWEVINSLDEPTFSNSSKVQIFLAVVAKKNIALYEKCIKNSGLLLKKVEIESVATVKSLIGEDKKKFVIVDIGYMNCNIDYVEGGFIKINRSISIGGNTLTKNIARSLGISEERAEAMKLSGTNFFGSEMNIQLPTLEIILEEIKRILKVASEKEVGSEVETIILTGGTSDLLGIADFFQSRLGVKTILGNPFNRVNYDSRVESVLEAVKTKFPVSIGVTLK